MKQHIFYIKIKRKKVDKSDCTTEVCSALGQTQMMGSLGLKIYLSIYLLCFVNYLELHSLNQFLQKYSLFKICWKGTKVLQCCCYFHSPFTSLTNFASTLSIPFFWNTYSFFF